jgi:glycopeptide antibiotics resistance protein
MLANLLGAVLGVIIYYLIREKCFNKWRGIAAKAVNK